MSAAVAAAEAQEAAAQAHEVAAQAQEVTAQANEAAAQAHEATTPASSPAGSAADAWSGIAEPATTAPPPASQAEAAHWPSGDELTESVNAARAMSEQQHDISDASARLHSPPWSPDDVTRFRISDDEPQAFHIRGEAVHDEPVIDLARLSTSADDTAGAPPTAGSPPATPYPNIGIDDDPLGIRAMPPARGSDSIIGRAGGQPGDQPDGSDGATNPITITAPHDASGRGPSTISGNGADGTRGDSWSAPPIRHDSVVMPEWTGPATPPRGRARAGYSVLAVLLLGAFAAQSLFHYRNVIAADYPVTRQWLVSACAPAWMPHRAPAQSRRNRHRLARPAGRSRPSGPADSADDVAQSGGALTRISAPRAAARR